MPLKAPQSAYARSGEVVYTGVGPNPRESVKALNEVLAMSGKSLMETAKIARAGNRQITLISIPGECHPVPQCGRQFGSSKPV